MKKLPRLVLLALWTFACGDDLPPTGTEGGRCYPNGTCNDGLRCLSARCVLWDPDGWAEDLAGDPAPEAMPEFGEDARDVPWPDDAPGAEQPDGEWVDPGFGDESGPDEALDPGTDPPDGSDVDACEGECVSPPDPCPGEMCQVPAGTFWMGANRDGTQCPANQLDPIASVAELPCHTVDVPEFFIDRYEVTVARYRAYLAAKGEGCTNPDDGSSCVPKAGGNWDYPGGGREEHPVDNLTWYQARGFCQWAGKRLCSESEWEKAARGTDGRLYPWGNEAPSCDYAVIRGSEWNGCDTRATFPVGSKPRGRSPYGVDDMAGNVAEWVQDWYVVHYDGAPIDGSAREWVTRPELPWDRSRVVRGGAIQGDAFSVRASGRGSSSRTSQMPAVGFRCCRSSAP